MDAGNEAAVIKTVFAGTGQRVRDELTYILDRLKDGRRSLQGRVDVVEFVVSRLKINNHPVRVRVHGLDLAMPSDDIERECFAGADAAALLIGVDEVERRAVDFASHVRAHLDRSGALGDTTPMVVLVIGRGAFQATESVAPALKARGHEIKYSDSMEVLRTLCEQVVTWHRDPLAVLASFLEKGRVPAQWFGAHGQAFEKLWHACLDATLLIRIAAKLSDRAAVARAACACARAALRVHSKEKAMEKALGIAEARARGAATAKEFEIACRPLAELAGVYADDLAMAIIDAGCVLDDIECAEHAVGNAAAALSGDADLAGIIRAHIDLPDLDAHKGRGTEGPV